jgi:hypothetical protein
MFGPSGTSSLIPSSTQGELPETHPGESVLKIESDRKLAEKFGKYCS